MWVCSYSVSFFPNGFEKADGIGSLVPGLVPPAHSVMILLSNVSKRTYRDTNDSRTIDGGPAGFSQEVQALLTRQSKKNTAFPAEVLWDHPVEKDTHRLPLPLCD